MENQKLNKGADLYPSMDDAGERMASGTGVDADPGAEKPAGAAELMTPGNAPGPEDNAPSRAESNRDDNTGRKHALDDEQMRDVRMQGANPASLDTNFGDGGTNEGTGLSDTSGSTGSGSGNTSGSRSE